jgi:gamma-glutamyltranspeptidase/glutathione hydrolase
MVRYALTIIICYSVFSCTTSNKLVLAPLVEGHSKKQHEVSGSQFVITSSGEGASFAGERMYAMGGNIYDAFAAMSFAISVERPQSTGIGGGGFAMIYDPAQKQNITAVDFREAAPLAATERMFQDGKGEVIPGKSTATIFAVATPGLVAGVLDIHKRHGKLTRAEVLQPAIELAEKGFKVYPHLANALKEQTPVLKKFSGSAKIFFHKDGRPLEVGDLLVQTDLAQTLRLIAKDGEAAFYRGKIRDQILAENKKWGGILTAKDFSDYKVKFRKDVAAGTYGKFQIFSMPPPSSGGAHVIEILNIVEPLNLKQFGAHAPYSVHMTAAAMQQAFADRAAYLGDADFVKVPLKGITSKKYAAEILKRTPKDKATPSSTLKAGNPLPYESSETTHFTIADSSGAMLASTQTINGYFGSGIVASGSGIVLNNEMDDFSAKPGASNLFGAIGGTPNKIQPKKRPLSSMSPTLILKDNKPFMALGTPSGTRILTCVALTALNVLEYEMPLYDAVAAVRYHHQWQPDEIRFDEPGLPPDTINKLEAMGYKLNKKNLECKVNAVMFNKDATLLGVSDPRSEGLSIAK